MRKIESEMVAAVANGRSWSKTNTQVFVNKKEGKPLSVEVWLHSQLIATITGGKVLMLHFGSRYHFSRTTFSRMNALLRQFCKPEAGVFTHRHRPMLSGLGRDIFLSVGDTWTFNVYR
jgi:hypothetical protein